VAELKRRSVMHFSLKAWEFEDGISAGLRYLD
jgi:hypothetical protein